MRRTQFLTDSALRNLASLVAAVDAAEAADIPWRGQISVHFLRNFTIEPVEPYLKFHLLREDIKAQISYGGYDTMSQEILDPVSSINQRRPDVIVLSLLLEYLDSGCTADRWTANQALARLDDLVALVLENTSSLIVGNTLLRPIDSLIAEAQDSDRVSEIQKLNDRMRKLEEQNPHRIRLSDWEQHIVDAGADDAIDRRFWRLSQSPFTSNVLNRIALDVTQYIRPLKDRSKKCLVLDCDNTLWGGVIGEDGTDGIALHPEEPPGSAFYKLQKSVLKLHEQGILIVLCSKNNEEDVWGVLAKHPHCLLKQAHLVAWRINWKNKAENIESLADELNIGLDSMVFVDDSPRECALVNEILPDVTVLQIPTDLEHHEGILTKDSWFNSLARSDEDRRRTQMYRDATLRQRGQNRFDSLTDYLKSLDTVLEIARPAEADLARVVQLTQRTNQFNLTTRRYSETEIRGFSTDENTALFSMKARDRYGDMGLTGVFIVKRKDLTGVIDSLLLSCRVLGRQLEFAFVDQCMKILEESWKLESWEANYVATNKNAQVVDFWDRIGLKLTADEAGTRQYSSAGMSRPSEYLSIMTIDVESAND